MIVETLIFSLIGVTIGVFAGLVPGIHINTTIPLLFSLSFLLPSQYILAVLIVSVAITEIFVDYISSIYLGAPEEDSALAVLPGHRLLLEGRGYEAIKLTTIGGLGSLIISLMVIVLLAPFFTYLYDMSRPYIHHLLIVIILFMILSERKPKKIASAVLIISLSGLLGVLTLSSSLIPQQNALFPLFTGMFGLSTLIVSLSERSKLPKQIDDSSLKISKKGIIKSLVLASIAGIIVGFLPAIGISEAATVVQYVGGTGESRSFLITVSGINTANDIFSLISLYLVGNPRSGASVAIQRILTELTLFDVLFLIGVICFVAGIAAILTLFLGKIIPKYLERLNYRYLCTSVIIFILTIIFLFTGPLGLLVAFTSLSVGLLCVYLEIRRSHCMGVLLLPSIIFFSGLNPTIISMLGI